MKRAQAKEAVEDEAAKAARSLDPKALIRIAAGDAICSAAMEFEARVQQQLGSILSILDASAAGAENAEPPPQIQADDAEASWQTFATRKAVADLQTWQQQASTSAARIDIRLKCS